MEISTIFFNSVVSVLNDRQFIAVVYDNADEYQSRKQNDNGA